MGGVFFSNREWRPINAKLFVSIGVHSRLRIWNPLLTEALHAETNKGNVSICPNGQRKV
jgi:hypothetical protein